MFAEKEVAAPTAGAGLEAVPAANGQKEVVPPTTGQAHKEAVPTSTQQVDKEAVLAKGDASGSSKTPSVNGHLRGIDSNSELDEAYKYIEHHDHGAEQGAGVYSSALRRTIDWRIVPIMFACYTMQFLDKVLLNYAAVMGLNANLKLKGNDFSNAGSAFFIAYLIAEIPNGFILQVVPAGKWLGANVVLWGIATACTAAAHNYHSLLAARIFLGIFEAAIAPSLMLISSQWYTKSEQAPRFSFWYCGLGFAQILGGIISFGFQHVHNTSFPGWKVMFVVLGLVTSLIGFLTMWILPDTPMTARFLSESQKVALLKHVSVNQTGIENKHFKFRQLLEILLDVQLWLLTLLTILISVSSGVITTYSATLIKNFGYSSPTAALLNMPSGIVSIFATLLVGFGVRHSSHRWAWISACCIPGIIGGGLMSFMPSHDKPALLAGIYLVNFVVATLPLIYQWTVANCAGQTKRVFASALIAGSFSVGNIIGPQTFQARDAPKYLPAKTAVLATQASAVVVAFVLFLYYVWANKRKDRAAGTQHADGLTAGETEADHWVNKTDKQNPTFRYVY